VKSTVETFQASLKGSTWVFTMSTTMCSQFSMLNIYYPYGCDLKGRALVRRAACSEFDAFVGDLQEFFYFMCFW
jgi:hypothetical protein